jgi:excisionase family DNA binding protein
MTTREVAQYLNVPISTLYNWRQKASGPKSFRVGRGTRYRREDVELWLHHQERA